MILLSASSLNKSLIHRENIMARFDRIRYRYLYSDFSPKSYDFGRFDKHVLVQKHPHTCIAVRVMADTKEIHYAIARRESAGKLLALRNRINMIRNLGGIVPEAMTKAVSSYPRNFSKSKAREIACRKLSSNPHIITVTDMDALNAHTITQMVMEGIVADYGFEYSPEVATAAESAAAWLTDNVEEFRNTLPGTLMDQSFLELAEVVSDLFLGPDTEAAFGMVDDELALEALAKGPSCF